MNGDTLIMVTTGNAFQASTNLKNRRCSQLYLYERKASIDSDQMDELRLKRMTADVGRKSAVKDFASTDASS